MLPSRCAFVKSQSAGRAGERGPARVSSVRQRASTSQCILSPYCGMPCQAGSVYYCEREGRVSAKCAFFSPRPHRAEILWIESATRGSVWKRRPVILCASS